MEFTLNTLHPRRLLALVALLTLSLAVAQDGLELSVAAYPTGGAVAAIHATLPLFETRDVQHAVRADVAYAFEGLPGVSASYLLRDTTRDMLAPYLGAGVGISFPEEPASSPLLSGHGLVGFRVPLTGRLGAFTEAVVAGNAFGTRLDLGVGITYSFGGSN